MFRIAEAPETPQIKTDLLVLFLPNSFLKKKTSISGHIKPFDSLIRKMLSYNDFKADFREHLLFYPPGLEELKRVVILGVGDTADRDLHDSRMLGYELSRIQKKTTAARIHVLLSGSYLCNETHLTALAEGIRFQQYEFHTYKKDKKKKKRQPRYTFLCSDSTERSSFRRALSETELGMESVRIARDLSNEPSNVCTPEYLKRFVTSHFKETERIHVEALNSRRLEELGFNAMLAVGKGSREKPYLIIMHYQPERKTRKCLAVLGKGVTFDSGGISIKPSKSMDEMKYDMAGAAATIAFMHAVSRIRPVFEVVGVVPAVENMPGSAAFKPGDIVRAYNGKNIEILNTDAEGRLILADAISYTVERYKPGVILDLATLTGSILAALGDKAAGLFTSSEVLRDLLVKAGDRSGDLLWPMPMWKLYNEDVKSDVADVKNLGGRWAGAIAAAKFLEHFTTNTAWAHIDMAGTAYDVKGIDYLGTGATGYGPRLLIQVLKEIKSLL